MSGEYKVRLASIGAGMIGHVHAQVAAGMHARGECEYVALCVAAGTKPMEDIHGIVAAIATTKGTT